MDSVKLTKGEAYSLAEFIDMSLIDFIRDNTDMDSMAWLKNMVNAYVKLCKYSGFIGLTENHDDDDVIWELPSKPIKSED